MSVDWCFVDVKFAEKAILMPNYSRLISGSVSIIKKLNLRKQKVRQCSYDHAMKSHLKRMVKIEEACSREDRAASRCCEQSLFKL